MPECVFCKLTSGEVDGRIVFEDEVSVAFLDARPLFPGHTLLVPRSHIEVLADLPGQLLKPFFANLQMLVRAVEAAMNAEGTFVANNNKVSQSVPHLHFHIVPRKKKDGLKGFFWPRGSYRDEAHQVEVQEAIRHAVEAERRKGYP